MVTVNVVVPLVVTVGGLNDEQVGACATAGVTVVHINETVPVKPPVGATVIIEVADPPGAIEAGLAALALRPKLVALVTVRFVVPEEPA